MNMTTIELVQKRLKTLGKTQRWLAKEIGNTEQNLSKMLHNSKPDYDSLERLSKALGCLPGDRLPHTETNNVRCPKCGHEFHVALNAEEE